MRRALGVLLAVAAVLALASCSAPTSLAPRVTSFAATPNSIAGGSSATLSWNLQDGTDATLSIDHGVGDVTGETSVTVHPAQTTTYTLVATHGSLADSARTTVTVTGYDIALDYISSVTTTQRSTFESARARWSGIITHELSPVTVSIPKGACLSPTSAEPNLPYIPSSTIATTIQDLRIDVAVVPIDGPGGILGEGGPCYVRGGSNLPVYGFILFDSSDLATLQQQGLLGYTVLHEMGHVLGIGTVWQADGLLTGVGTTDPRFTGANAVREWHALGGSGNVPVANCLNSNGTKIQNCGSGTLYGHWREAVFGDELMTGFLNNGPNPLSRMTIGSLQDLGYAVDYSLADPYSLPSSTTTLALAPAPAGRFVLVAPKRTVP